MKFFAMFLRAWDAFSMNKFAFSINNFFEAFFKGEIALKFPNLKFKIRSYLLIKGSLALFDVICGF